MTGFLFDLPPVPAVPVRGADRAYPVRRIFCVGRNYAEHAAEMGFAVDREEPFYFTKFPSAIVLSGATIPYPPGTADFHWEMELVVAIGAPAFRIPDEAAGSVIFGYASGLDMTRRDLQKRARDRGRPWDLGKNGENAAPIAAITPAAAFGAPGERRITLEVDGTLRQDARLSDMVWSVPEVVSHLSRYYRLGPGDLIYTGTPAGVGAVRPGQRLVGRIDDLDPLEITIGSPEAP
jgi:fumarylpyruvate hydrolase